MEGESLVPDSTIGRILVAVDQKDPTCMDQDTIVYNTSVEEAYSLEERHVRNMYRPLWEHGR